MLVWFKFFFLLVCRQLYLCNFVWFLAGFVIVISGLKIFTSLAYVIFSYFMCYIVVLYIVEIFLHVCRQRYLCNLLGFWLDFWLLYLVLKYSPLEPMYSLVIFLCQIVVLYIALCRRCPLKRASLYGFLAVSMKFLLADNLQGGYELFYWSNFLCF